MISPVNTGRSPGAGPPLVIDDVSKTYTQGGREIRALDHISLHVDAGEIVALLGNNGAGKTTLMSIAAGLIATDGGSVLVEGECVTEHGGRPSDQLGLAPQDEALFPSLTVRQNLAYFGRLSGLKRNELAKRVDDVAGHLLLQDQLDRRASTLSGGQRRRLHTGLALMHEPTVLLLDEPTVGVDIEARSEVLDFVRSTATQGAAILYSTHQLHEVERLGARVVIIDGGRLLAAGSVAELIGAYAPPMIELRFDSDRYSLPPDMLSALDESGWKAGQFRIVARLAAPDIAVSEVVEYLPPDARNGLLGANVVPPDLETAYRRLVRSEGSSLRSSIPDEGEVVA
jgi:ABC-2 type transport system ATP-binding protein